MSHPLCLVFQSLCWANWQCDSCYLLAGLHICDKLTTHEWITLVKFCNQRERGSSIMEMHLIELFSQTGVVHLQSICLYTDHIKRCRHFIQWVISIVWKCFTGYYSTYSQRCNFRFLHEKGVFSPSTKEAPPKAPLGTMMRL